MKYLWQILSNNILSNYITVIIAQYLDLENVWGPPKLKPGSTFPKLTSDMNWKQYNLADHFFIGQ